MGYTVISETFAGLESYRKGNGSLRWEPIFVLPGWLEAWWEVFGGEGELYLRAIRRDEEVLGIAPLYLKGDTATFIGSPDVCDYLDFVVAPGREEAFFQALLDDLDRRGIRRLDLQTVRPESVAVAHLLPLAKQRGLETRQDFEDVSLEMELPPAWEDYFVVLTRKQRHELKRKLRRLEEEGKVDYQVIKEPAAAEASMSTFLKLLSLNPEKAGFLTPAREQFFHRLSRTMAEAGLLRLGVLGLDGATQAVVMGFDYQDCVYLYNNGYTQEHASTSIGTISKALLIKDAIQRGRKRFDFLKGGEVYKYQMGGKEVPLYHAEVILVK